MIPTLCFLVRATLLLAQLPDARSLLDAPKK